MRTRLLSGHVFAALAAAFLVASAPRAAMAAGDPPAPAQPPAGQGRLVVERVYNGPLFGAEFKFTEIGGREAYLFGGYAGVIFDNRFFVGGAGYWQANDGCNGGGGDYYYGYGGCDDYYDDDYYDDYYHGYHDVSGYGGLVLEWYALRSSVASVSARGLIGGGVAKLGWNDYYVPEQPKPMHGGGYYPPGGYYYTSNQGYFVFEPQLNITMRVAPGFAVVGGAGYRVVAWANGWEDQLQGFTGTVALRIGGR